MDNDIFFVMLRTQQGSVTPMLEQQDGFEELATYTSKEAARVDAQNNVFGEHFGYEIFRLGDGDA